MQATGTVFPIGWERMPGKASRTTPTRHGDEAVSHSSVSTGPGPMRGRRPSKHSDKNYTQTSICLPIVLRNRVGAKLDERGAEMSGLIEQMLRERLANGKEVLCQMARHG